MIDSTHYNNLSTILEEKDYETAPTIGAVFVL